MLEIKKISKIYKMEGFEQKALDNVSVNFREHEFASQSRLFSGLFMP